MREERKPGFTVRDRRTTLEDGEGDAEEAFAADLQGAGDGDEAAALESEPGRPTAGPPPELAAEVERMRQALAELEDTKLRVERDGARQLELLRAEVLTALLPVLDNLERSIAAAGTTAPDDGLLAGVRLVHAQFLRALEGFGLERVSAIGARFDPRLHDAVAVIPVEDARMDGVVIDELEPAYRLGERVVRPAKVQVGRAAARPAT